jgi:hypothetical protein
VRSPPAAVMKGRTLTRSPRLALSAPVRSSLPRRVGAIVAAFSVAATLLLSGNAQAAGVSPALKLITADDSATLYSFQGQGGVYLDLGLYLGSVGAPFEIQVARPDYLQPAVASQVLHGPNGETEMRAIPADLLEGWEGLKDFLEIEITKRDGTPVKTLSVNLCPNGYERQRLSDEGPAIPTYPDGCYSNPFTRGVIWGIDHDWAVNPLGYSIPPVRLPLGRYIVTARIGQPFIDFFGIDPMNSSATYNVRVKEYEDECGEHGCAGHSARQQMERSGAVPTMDDPDPSLLPDLQALPAFGIGIDHRRKKDFLTFGANLWAAGAASLVVEGFRRTDEDIMDAYQYFYQDGEAIGRAPVGELAYDPRDGHTHWHFQQFAAYTLLGESQNEIVRSKKEAFCLAPTDAIDQLLPGAVRNPGSIGLGTNCGGPNAIWIREVLPLGWGDTYYQGLPGQSFNITNLPNGTYYIAVEANPAKNLFEQDYENNVELREITLKGRFGTRRVIVPPWNGIDTETGGGMGQG